MLCTIQAHCRIDFNLRKQITAKISNKEFLFTCLSFRLKYPPPVILKSVMSLTFSILYFFFISRLTKQLIYSLQVSFSLLIFPAHFSNEVVCKIESSGPVMETSARLLVQEMSKPFIHLVILGEQTIQRLSAHVTPSFLDVSCHTRSRPRASADQ